MLLNNMILLSLTHWFINNVLNQCVYMSEDVFSSVSNIYCWLTQAYDGFE